VRKPFNPPIPPEGKMAKSPLPFRLHREATHDKTPFNHQRPANILSKPMAVNNFFQYSSDLFLPQI
jgi:hypothetical protein